MMRVSERGTIFDATAAEPAARFCTFPSLARTAGGRLVAGFRVGSSKDSADEDVRVMVSDDEGATWQMAFAGFGAFPPESGGRIPRHRAHAARPPAHRFAPVGRPFEPGLAPGKPGNARPLADFPTAM